MNEAKRSKDSSLGNSLRNGTKKPVVTVRDAIFAKDSFVTVHVTTTRKDSHMPDKPQRPYSGKDEGSNWAPIRKNPTPLKKAVDIIRDKMNPRKGI